MLDSLVRICEIRLTGFKNTTCGVVQMPSELNEAYFMRHADVLGIYRMVPVKLRLLRPWTLSSGF